MQDLITIRKESPMSEDAKVLLEALSNELFQITGATGKATFNVKDVMVNDAFFVIARNEAHQAVGCGAIRPINAELAEVKRVYAVRPNQGIGSQILQFLEQESRHLGYKRLRLETRVINQTAVKFYLSRGYQVIANYGPYVNHKEAICFEKDLSATLPK